MADYCDCENCASKKYEDEIEAPAERLKLSLPKDELIEIHHFILRSQNARNIYSSCLNIVGRKECRGKECIPALFAAPLINYGQERVYPYTLRCPIIII